MPRWPKRPKPELAPPARERTTRLCPRCRYLLGLEEPQCSHCGITVAGFQQTLYTPPPPPAPPTLGERLRAGLPLLGWAVGLAGVGVGLHALNARFTHQDRGDLCVVLVLVGAFLGQLWAERASDESGSGFDDE